MFTQAHLLHERGLTSGQVLLNCYGVPFPFEIFILNESGKLANRFPVDFTNQPWKLISSQVKDSAQVHLSSMAKLEQVILDRDPDLVPLALLVDSSALHGGKLVCYRLTELSAGRSTVYSLPRCLPPDTDAVRAGESFLSVMHEHHASVHDQWQRRLDSVSNRGDGSMDEGTVAEARAWLNDIEDLQQQVVQRSA
ncbi:hypothetical protein [Streptomyces sp. cmx-18-6]|uniref:hypothetical protein n=1 Tax=Streptomyces sp. cmx-18-6 TaxID=2790930 RepID=UPI00397FB2C2